MCCSKVSYCKLIWQQRKPVSFFLIISAVKFSIEPRFLSIFRSLKNRFVPQHVRFIQTTAQLLEVVKVPPFADSVSEGDVK